MKNTILMLIVSLITNTINAQTIKSVISHRKIATFDCKFMKQTEANGNEKYLFVLKETDNGKVNLQKQQIQFKVYHGRLHIATYLLSTQNPTHKANLAKELLFSTHGKQSSVIQIAATFQKICKPSHSG